MPTSPATNWFGDVTSNPRVIADATCANDIVAILQNTARYPSPVRAVGSSHSTTACGEAEGGTLIRMKMNRILRVNPDKAAPTVTVESGSIYIDIADELRKHNLQFHVTTEIGNLSAGSAACCGTKDSSFEGELRAGRLICHRAEDGAGFRRASGNHRRPAGTDAEGPSQLRDVRDCV